MPAIPTNPPPTIGQAPSSATPAVKDEIDAQFELLEFGGPASSNTAPTGPIDAAPPITLDDTAATQARPRGALPPIGTSTTANGNARPSRRPPDLSFSTSHDEATESGQIVPGALQASRPQSSPLESVSPGAGVTDRPMQQTDPFLGEPEPGPSTMVADNPLAPLSAVEPAAETSPGGASDDSLAEADFEDPTGADMKLDLGSTSDANILIADDIADSMDEETGTSPTVPPYRQGS
jgi:hypothetical protein